MQYVEIKFLSGVLLIIAAIYIYKVQYLSNRYSVIELNL